MGEGDIDSAEMKAMMRLLKPLIDRAYNMSGHELALAMRGFYATSQSNCAWYAYALRHQLPPMLAVIGEGKDGFKEAWDAPKETDHA